MTFIDFVAGVSFILFLLDPSSMKYVLISDNYSLDQLHSEITLAAKMITRDDMCPNLFEIFKMIDINFLLSYKHLGLWRIMTYAWGMAVITSCSVLYMIYLMIKHKFHNVMTVFEVVFYCSFALLDYLMVSQQTVTNSNKHWSSSMCFNC